MEKIVSQLSADGYFINPVAADESPLEPGVYLIPGGAIDISPPDVEAGKAYKLDGSGSGWLALDDHRSDVLFATSDGVRYEIGQVHDSDGTYSGLGPIPAWLTATPRPDVWSVWKSGKWVRDETAWRASVLAGNTAKKAQLTTDASARIATLQDAVDLQMATVEEAAALKLWRVYRVELSRVDVSMDSPTWPSEPVA
ncbi:tail fiber assembly protein [Achromobacter insuavis]